MLWRLFKPTGAETELGVLRKALNRRAGIEQLMFDAARGKRPMPSQQELFEWAMALGDPTRPLPK